MATKFVSAAALLGATLFALSPAALAADYQITNQSSHDLEEFYAAPAGSGAWGDDILGGGFLPAGNAASVTINDQGQCAFDLRFVVAGGDAIEESGVDICANAAYTVTD